jgi:hypothetical protein
MGARKTATSAGAKEGAATNTDLRPGHSRQEGRTTKEVETMLCYPCAKNGVERPAVALCTSCSAGLCREHLLETATQLASDNPFAGCHHDTWVAGNRRRPQRLAAGPWLRTLHRDRPSRPGHSASGHRVAESDSTIAGRRGERR